MTTGYESFMLGATRLGYHTDNANLEWGRAELANNVREFPVERVEAGRWQATLAATAFGEGGFNRILQGYLDAATRDIPFSGFLGYAAGDDVDLVLVSLHKAGEVGVNGDARWTSEISAKISSRRPFHDARVLHYTLPSAGLSVSTAGAALNAGGVGAGQELVAVVHHPHWPSLGQTHVATYKLQSSPDDTFALPTDHKTWTPTAGKPDYKVWTIDGDAGAVADPYWRLDISGVTGTVYPASSLVIATKE